MLSVTVAGISLDNCIYNASGPRTGVAGQLEAIAKSRSGAVLSKSATLVCQDGNPHPRYLETDSGSINSEGLPNKGIDYYISKECIDPVTQLGKPYIVSLSGLKLKDNIEMIKRAVKTPNVAAIELNLACPNIPGKPVIAYDFEQMEEVLEAVFNLRELGTMPLGVKLAPYFDMPHYERVSAMLNKYPVKFVVCTNTVGNALLVDADKEEAMIKPKGGYGGLGGRYIKQIALANVRKFSQMLREDIDVIGVGGVETGRDAFELILCGAKAVQVGTCHRKEGPKCFDRISGELETMMREKGYTHVSEFRGKLANKGEGRKDFKKKVSASVKVDAKISLDWKHLLIIIMAIYLALRETGNI